MKKIIVGIILFAASFLWAHGGDEPGPHGGFVKMPGAFHTELVQLKDGTFKVYLLDMEFKNPVVENSEVKAWSVSGSKKSEIPCEAMGNDHFHCMPKVKPIKGEQLIVKAKRDQAQGNEATYKLPLKLEK